MANHFPSIQEPILKKALEQDASLRDNQIPFGKFQYVDITLFTGHENDITHSLNPKNPDDVRWIVVRSNAPASVYRSDPTAIAWTSSTIRLLTNVNNVTVRLLLFLEA